MYMSFFLLHLKYHLSFNNILQYSVIHFIIILNVMRYILWYSSIHMMWALTCFNILWYIPQYFMIYSSMFYMIYSSIDILHFHVLHVFHGLQYHMTCLIILICSEVRFCCPPRPKPWDDVLPHYSACWKPFICTLFWICPCCVCKTKMHPNRSFKKKYRTD